jgi:hypothetical protein
MIAFITGAASARDAMATARSAKVELEIAGLAIGRRVNCG